MLWGWLLAQGIKIHFAHRTFRWSNEASGKAAVHCVIVGFGLNESTTKTIFEYDDVNGEPHPVIAGNISPYLVDANDTLLLRRNHPIRPAPEIGIGNKPIDGGWYLFTEEERAEFVATEPQADKWFRRWMGSEEFINGSKRFCLWLGECSPAALRQMPTVLARVDAVRNFRKGIGKAKKSTDEEQDKRKAPPKSTQALGDRPTRFHVENMPNGEYLLIPKVSSERRKFIPIGFLDGSTLASDLVFIVRDGRLGHFGVLSSTMHNAWMRAVCGRLESRYRYSAGIVYNNFPWPDIGLSSTTLSPQPSPARGRGGPTGDVAAQANANLTKADAASAKLRSAIESAAQSVLDARAAHPESSLADLYDPVAMPPDLTEAHQKLDAAVDAAYFAAHAADGAKKTWRNDAERVAFLFTLYQKFTSLLPVDSVKSRSPDCCTCRTVEGRDLGQ